MKALLEKCDEPMLLVTKDGTEIQIEKGAKPKLDIESDMDTFLKLENSFSKLAPVPMVEDFSYLNKRKKRERTTDFKSRLKNNCKIINHGRQCKGSKRHRPH